MRLCLSAAILAAVASVDAQTTPPIQDQTPQAMPIPTGVVPLPSGSPNTRPQGSLPKPAEKPVPPDRPLAWSPDLNQLKGFVDKQPITIDQAVAISLYASRSFATAVAVLEQASGRTGETRAQLFPSLGVNGNLAYYDKATTVSFAAFSGATTTTSSASAAPLVVLPQFNPVFTAALSLPIDIFGTLRSAASQAQFAEVAARIDVNRVRNQVVYDVKSAFYNVLRASAQVAVANDNLDNALARLEDANKNYSAGTASRFDITTAQRDVADAQQGLIQAKAQVSNNLATLKNTMGLDVSSRVSIESQGAIDYPEGVLPPIIPKIGKDGTPTETPSAPVDGSAQTQNPEVPKVAPPINRGDAPAADPHAVAEALDPKANKIVTDDFDFGPDYNRLVSEALESRPEILEAEAQVTAGHRGLQYALRSILPSFNLSLEDVYTANSTPLERKNQEAIVLGISVPLFDGGLAKAAVREQRGTIAQAEVNRLNAKGQVVVDVQQAYIALVQSRQRVAVSNVEVSQARESYRVSRVRYRAGVSGQAGVSPQLELSNAQTTLAQAESNQVNALYDYNNARAQLDRAVGRYGFSGIGPGYKSTSDIPKLDHPKPANQ